MGNELFARISHSHKIVHSQTSLLRVRMKAYDCEVPSSVQTYEQRQQNIVAQNNSSTEAGSKQQAAAAVAAGATTTTITTTSIYAIDF